MSVSLGKQSPTPTSHRAAATSQGQTRNEGRSSQRDQGAKPPSPHSPPSQGPVPPPAGDREGAIFPPADPIAQGDSPLCHLSPASRFSPWAAAPSKAQADRHLVAGIRQPWVNSLQAPTRWQPVGSHAGGPLPATRWKQKLESHRHHWPSSPVSPQLASGSFKPCGDGSLKLAITKPVLGSAQLQPCPVPARGKGRAMFTGSSST